MKERIEDLETLALVAPGGTAPDAHGLAPVALGENQILDIYHQQQKAAEAKGRRTTDVVEFGEALLRAAGNVGHVKVPRPLPQSRFASRDAWAGYNLCISQFAGLPDVQALADAMPVGDIQGVYAGGRTHCSVRWFGDMPALNALLYTEPVARRNDSAAADTRRIEFQRKNPTWSMRWRLKDNRDQWQMLDDGEPWGKWGEYRQVLDAAIAHVDKLRSK